MPRKPFSLRSKYWRALLSVVFSLSGIFLALLSFAYTCSTNRTNDSRWLALNQPRFVYDGVRAIASEEFLLAEAQNRNWGYQPLVFPHTEGYLQSDKLRAYTHLILFDPEGGTRLFGHVPVRTVEQAHSEAIRLGFERYEVRQMFQYEVNFRNGGQLPAHEVWVQSATSLCDGEVFHSHRTEPVQEVAGGARFHSTAALYFPVEKRVPECLRIQMTIGFSAEDLQRSDSFTLEYDSHTNTWAWRR